MESISFICRFLAFTFSSKSWLVFIFSQCPQFYRHELLLLGFRRLSFQSVSILWLGCSSIKLYAIVTFSPTAFNILSRNVLQSIILLRQWIYQKFFARKFDASCIYESYKKVLIISFFKKIILLNRFQNIF